MGRKKKVEEQKRKVYDRDFGELEYIDVKEYLRKKNSRYVGTGHEDDDYYDIVCVGENYYYTYI